MYLFLFFILYQDARSYQLYLEIMAASGHDRGYRMSSSLRNSPLGTRVTQKALIIAWHEAMNTAYVPNWNNTRQK